MPAILQNMVSGLQAQMRTIDLAGRNLTNAQTPGYVKARALFHDLMYDAMQATHDRSGAPQPQPVGGGSALRDDQIITTQGDLQSTGQELDLAIRGEGFFQFTGTDGQPVYSRNGQFALDPDGRLVNSTGLPLQPELRVPPGVEHVQVAADGTVRGSQPDGTVVEIGQVQLATFANPSGLAQNDAFLLAATPASGPAQPLQPGQPGAGQLVQGALEGSNVDVSDEMINLLQAQRTYQVGLQALKAMDEALGEANTIRRA